ncbi:hypothetical protein THASP1DRAFT_29660 [Thamnocephalis sphaerospora]|uniref:Serine/threonine-protein phosphatase 2A activator n=1 Tax=Thamnocephalis sphaerospora TaxID=78915 RepID=A0A4V1IWS2_9FUNG|nr:hypothetical protein THASP1DRAFT_29660 [Thamnocephalis sphaerospora]|eukprot:RKP08549.1 hypothetical protein THASP1DRAFT_29660 [Thamnocephalis sphaerospora]
MTSLPTTTTAPHQAAVTSTGSGAASGGQGRPSRRICAQQDMAAWQTSEAYARLLHYLKRLNECALNRRLSDPCSVERVLRLLDLLNTWIDELPPLPSPQRFGNKAFRQFVVRLEEQAPTLMRNLVPESQHDLVGDLVAYFTTAFGNGTRVDYGSGHELAFVAWLCCLRILGVFVDADDTAVVMRVFPRYLAVVRRLQRVYSLEPAGSHGVWGLDDFQFLPYYWGSAQLFSQRRPGPKTVLDKQLVEEYAKENMYFGCIQVINTVKHGPFHEHSPLLHDIAMVPTWAKVNTGMLKMYQAEVLGKFPVVQHLEFGTLLPFEPAHTDTEPSATAQGKASA